MTVGHIVESTPVRILHVITGLGTGGAESSLLRVISHTQHHASHAVVSLTTSGSRGEELLARGVPVYTLGLARGSIAPAALVDLRRIVREFQPTCVQGWMYHGNLAASLVSLTGAHTGPVLWNVRHALDAWDRESGTLRGMVRVSAMLSRHPHRIIYNSHRAAAQHIARGFMAGSTHVIPNGVILKRYAINRDERIPARNALGIPANAFVIGMIARVDPLKDHRTFLGAVAQHAATDRETWFVLAGAGTEAGALGQPAPLDEPLRSLVNAHPELATRILRLGERHDVPDLMNVCDTLAMTSRSEGSPNVVAEAMACGIPCVVTDVGDAAHLVGDSGIVVKVGDALGIANAWRHLCDNPTERAARGQRAVERIRKYFSADREQAAYIALWSQASSGGGRARSHRPASDRAVGGSPPRILMVTTVSTTLRAFLLPIAQRYRSLGWRVDAMAAGADTDPSIARHFDVTHGIAWARNPFSLGNLAVMRRIREVVRVGAYDIVHVHTPIAAFVTRLALRREKSATVVYTAHGFHAHPGGARLSNAFFRWIERRAARWTDYLVVMNEHDAALAQRDGLAQAGRLAHHPGIGVDVRQYRPPGRDARDRVRQSLGIPATQSVIVVVAEFNRNKRQRDVVAALVRLRDEATIPMPIVLFIGDGPCRAMVSRHARAAGVESHVRFLGQRDDVASLVGASDALVLASKREGLPRCLLEAMCMGVPVVASMARGSVDLLGGERGHERGWLYPVGDIARLADRLRVVLGDRSGAQVRAQHAEAWIHAAASLDQVLLRHDVLYDAARRRVPLTDPIVTPAARIPGIVPRRVSSAA